MKDVYIRKPNDKERRLLESCPIWEHEPAQWNAEYDERCETCLIIEGTAVVSGSDGQSYAFTTGGSCDLSSEYELCMEGTGENP